ncbi:tRNA lysidine(34) synthetase TilS [Croceivirga thetidis]|uniref:tRNA(Ile)-lysidine synthase n=1 Tax=Croceivirga thetidis TaxID=2721623 RepID=A0ABX1GRA3_9FLAO|nr:tRNA lysidine(34) synthetase TilS [Croceivirga thetidis]NKI32477.1 tRNA lysidine(34) synthetase TilS [Croceivirga thetidis]
MLEKFKEHIAQWHWKTNKTSLLIACSGGLDSITLVHLCHELKLNFALAHCNYKLRGKDSDADETLVRELGDSLNKRVFVKSFDLKSNEKKGSIQTTARDLRYQWFKELIWEHGFKNVLTAHHLDDNLETFLINLSRGTGLAGLTGIPEENGRIIRPLLQFTRDEIKDYALDNNLNWREDASNSETKYLRNKIRHEVVPSLKDLNPEFLQNFEKTLNHLGSTKEILKRYKFEIQKKLFELKDNFIKISIKKLQKQNPKEDLLYLIFAEFGFTQWEDMLRLLDGTSGKEIRSNTHRLLKDRKSLILQALPSTESQDAISIQETDKRIDKPLKLNFELVEEFDGFTKNTLYVDKDKLKYPLVLRKKRKGDWFVPFGMEGKKKLSKFLKDEKIDQYTKEEVWLLCSNDQIVWVVGYRADNRFKVEKSTQQILRVKIG